MSINRRESEHLINLCRSCPAATYELFSKWQKSFSIDSWFLMIIIFITNASVQICVCKRKPVDFWLRKFESVKIRLGKSCKFTSLIDLSFRLISSSWYQTFCILPLKACSLPASPIWPLARKPVSLYKIYWSSGNQDWCHGVVLRGNTTSTNTHLALCSNENNSVSTFRMSRPDEHTPCWSPTISLQVVTWEAFGRIIKQARF